MDASQWTLFDKVMYGGLGYSAFCLPTDFFKVIVAILFPPLGELINILEDTITDTFPYLTWDCIKKLCTYESLNTIVYSFLLTTLFYIPGLIYTLTNIVNKERKINYDVHGKIIYEFTDRFGNPARITQTTINDVIYIKEITANRVTTIFQKSVDTLTDAESISIDKISSGGTIAIDGLKDIGYDIKGGFEGIHSGLDKVDYDLKNFEWKKGLEYLNPSRIGSLF
jgi:uncharacterized membrane protein YqaE (UPF0057 family)